MPDFLDESLYEQEGLIPFEFRPPLECEQPYTVSQINNGVAEILEAGNTLIWFIGEVSNCKLHTSGHCYLRLKDSHSQIPAVIWRSTFQRLPFTPENGQEVSGVAAIRVYRKGGYYQLDIRRMQPGGLGELYAAFEALKKRLMAEGLFDEEHKLPLPATVSTIGVITSKTGAALRDIVRVVKTRAPGTDIVLTNVRVQGDGAAAEIAAGIRRFNEHGGVDLLIVGRGGGSIEDLWAFNEETVARAIYESQIPIISAVGHETDFTIADFVADVRAPTPSAAAEAAVADDRERRRHFLTATRRLVGSASRYFEARRRELDRL
ncbi:MAG: exodeoxyribonuclease VII large subunit [Chitinivibrionales bacterium]|nr:exodeoxyribonuclease VII large subunit [Chitinivibrionales bacterium]